MFRLEKDTGFLYNYLLACIYSKNEIIHHMLFLPQHITKLSVVHVYFTLKIHESNLKAYKTFILRRRKEKGKTFAAFGRESGKGDFVHVNERVHARSSAGNGLVCVRRRGTKGGKRGRRRAWASRWGG